jgi:hypothetical protein
MRAPAGLAPRTAAPVELPSVAVEERVELERVEPPAPVAVRVPEEEAPLALGALAYNEALWNGVQLELAGTWGS